MRFTWAFPLAAMLSACSPQPSDEGQAKAQDDVQSLIASDDPRGCASTEAIRTALSAADRQYGEVLSKGMPAIRTDTVSATGVNKDIHELTCSATGHARSAFSDDEQSFPMIYKLRPALDQGGGYFAEIEANPLVKQMIGTHLFWWGRQNAPKQEATGGDEAEMQASATEATTGPDGVKKEDICNAEVLHEVPSIEDPSSKMKPGESYSDVTQFWRNKATGNTHFCQHGGYCYPSHVMINGQRTEAIRLINCSVQGQGEDDGEDILYGVG